MQLLPNSLPASLRPCVSRLARVVCTSAIDEHGLADAVVDHVALSMRSFPPHIRMALIAGLTALEQGARLHPGARGRSFSASAPAVQDAVFASLWRSPIPLVKQAIKGLKGLVALAYWDHPAVRERLGYAPEVWSAEVNARRLATYGAEIAAHDRFVVAPNPLTVKGGPR
jgi:hypothetical protein